MSLKMKVDSPYDNDGQVYSSWLFYVCFNGTYQHKHHRSRQPLQNLGGKPSMSFYLVMKHENMIVIV